MTNLNLPSQTKDTLRQSAQSILSKATDSKIGHKEFLTACESRFAKNPEGLSHDQYIAAANEIWDDVKLQQGAKPGHSDQASQGRRS